MSDAPSYFVDENLLGMGRRLQQAGRHDVLFPGHEQLPEVPRGTPDLEWMRAVAARGLVVLSRDRRIRSRPAELETYRRSGIRSVWLGAKQDLGPADQVALFLRYEHRLAEAVSELGPGPWALTLTPSTGIERLHLKGD